LQAYLRIRPMPASTLPYLSMVDEQSVLMTPPKRYNAKPPQLYTFDGIFGPTTTQEALFSQTTLPLIRSVLAETQNGLLFGYGVSNSGKTYSLQGGSEESRGIVPRAIDVMFNSIGSRLKPEGRVAGMDADEHMKPVDADDAGEDTGEPLLIGNAPLEQ
jgi:kinesin family protein 20